MATSTPATSTNGIDVVSALGARHPALLAALGSNGISSRGPESATTDTYESTSRKRQQVDAAMVAWGRLARREAPAKD
jgi:hypothetical protein